MEERINGTAGKRKRGSWWGRQLRKAVPDRAERSGSCEDFHLGEETRSPSAGPRRRGREATRCWYGGWRPWIARLEVWLL